MIIQGDSDAAYLVEPDDRSRAGGFHFLGSKERAMLNGSARALAKAAKAAMACSRAPDPGPETQSTVASSTSLVESIRRLVARAGRLQLGVLLGARRASARRAAGRRARNRCIRNRNAPTAPVSHCIRKFL